MPSISAATVDCLLHCVVDFASIPQTEHEWNDSRKENSLFNRKKHSAEVGGKRNGRVCHKIRFFILLAGAT